MIFARRRKRRQEQLERWKRAIQAEERLDLAEKRTEAQLEASRRLLDESRDAGADLVKYRDMVVEDVEMSITGRGLLDMLKERVPWVHS